MSVGGYMVTVYFWATLQDVILNELELFTK